MGVIFSNVIMLIQTTFVVTHMYKLIMYLLYMLDLFNPYNSLSSVYSKTYVYQLTHVTRALRSRNCHRTSSALRSELGLHIIVQY